MGRLAMIFLTLLPTLYFTICFGQVAADHNLYVASYSGYITHLKLHTFKNGSYALRNISATFASAPAPSWLSLEPVDRRILYAVNEGSDPSQKGSLTAYRLGQNGSFTVLSKIDTLFGPVHATPLWRSNMSREHSIVLADYGSSALQIFNLDKTSKLSLGQTFNFSLPRPGPAPAQTVSRPHSSAVDPTGSYLVVPDLGADLLRIFAISSAGSSNTSAPLLSPQTSLSFPPGCGPRWARFNVATSPQPDVPSSPVYLYVLCELTSTITTFGVTYDKKKQMVVQDIGALENYRPGTALPQGIAAAEMEISPDRQFLIASNRNDSSFLSNSTLASAGAASGGVDDSMVGYRISGANGSLEFQQFFSAGGKFPRQFQLNQQGNLMAVALQTDNKVAILSRNVTTGLVGGKVAEMNMGGAVGCIIWA